MSRVESKYWKCGQCGENCIRVLFAPWLLDAQDIISFADRNQHKYESEDCEVWVVGKPIDHNDNDSPLLTAKIWPTLERAENIRPSDFRKHIVHMEENHCHLEADCKVSYGIDDLRTLRKNYGF